MQKLMTGAFFRIAPITWQAIINPGALHIGGGFVFDLIAALGSAKVPNRIHVLMLDERFYQVRLVAGDNIDDTGWHVRGIRGPGRNR